MFNSTTFLKLRNKLCSITASAALFAFSANAEDNNPTLCGGILATIPGGMGIVTTAGPASGVYEGGIMPMATLTFTSSFMPDPMNPSSPSFKVVIDGVLQNNAQPSGTNIFVISQNASLVGTKTYSVVIAQQEQTEQTWCYKTATGISIIITQAACQSITSVSFSADKNAVTLVGDDMNKMQYNEQIIPTIVGGNFLEAMPITDGLEGAFQPFDIAFSRLNYGASFQDGSTTKTYAYKFRNSCSTVTSNVLSLTVTTVASLPCDPINFVGSNAPTTIPGLLQGNQLQANLNVNTTFSGNNLQYAWSLNGQPVMQPMASADFNISSELTIGTNNYTVTVSAGGVCSASVTPVVQSFSVNVITVTALPCQAAPTIFEFGFDIGGGNRVNSTTITQCGNGGISHNVGVGSEGPNDVNGLRFIYYKDQIEIGRNYSNYFNISTSTAGTSIYTMQAINNCGTTTSPLNLNTSITIQGNLTSCGNNNGGGNGGGNGTGSGVNCSKPTVTGIGQTSLNVTIFGTAMYTVSATTETGSITGYVWYKALPGVVPPLTNSSQVTTIFGRTNTLNIMYATADDAGYYAVSAINSCGRDSAPHFFDISVNTVVAPGFVPSLPAVATKDLGGDFSIPFTTPGFVVPIDDSGDFDLVWENVVGVNTANGDTYCVLLSVTPDFAKTYEICGLTAPGVSMTTAQLNSIAGILKPNLREEATATTQEYYYKVAPVVNNYKAAYSAPAKKAYQSASLQSVTGLALAQSDKNSDVVVYPNPNNGSFMVVASGNVVIYNVLGSKVQSFVASGATQVSGLAQGIYILSTETKKVKIVVE